MIKLQRKIANIVGAIFYAEQIKYVIQIFLFRDFL